MSTIRPRAVLAHHCQQDAHMAVWRLWFANAVRERQTRAEAVLYRWACGDCETQEVRAALQGLGVLLLERLNPHGLPIIDAQIGNRIVTLRF